MILAALLSLVLVVLSVLAHHEALRITRWLLPDRKDHERLRILVAFAGVLSAHLVSIFLFAFTYAYLHSVQALGGLAGELEGGFGDYVYFSMMSFTTLGVGDVYATGPLRIIAGFQALNGFVLIGWSASFAYVVMQKNSE